MKTFCTRFVTTPSMTVTDADKERVKDALKEINRHFKTIAAVHAEEWRARKNRMDKAINEINENGSIAGKRWDDEEQRRAFVDHFISKLRGLNDVSLGIPVTPSPISSSWPHSTIESSHHPRPLLPREPRTPDRHGRSFYPSSASGSMSRIPSSGRTRFDPDSRSRSPSPLAHRSYASSAPTGSSGNRGFAPRGVRISGAARGYLDLIKATDEERESIRRIVAESPKADWHALLCRCMPEVRAGQVDYLESILDPADAA